VVVDARGFLVDQDFGFGEGVIEGLLDFLGDRMRPVEGEGAVHFHVKLDEKCARRCLRGAQVVHGGDVLVGG